MTIFDTLFGRPQVSGHWVWAGIQQQLHTRTFPQVGCRVCEAEGWIAPVTPAIPARKPTRHPTPDPDAAKVLLSLAADDIQSAIDRITRATKDDPRLDEALDIYRERLRGIRAALESEAR